MRSKLLFFIYDILMLLLFPFVLLAVLFHSLVKPSEFRRNVQRLGFVKFKDKTGKKRFWFHAVSVGEVAALQRILSVLKDMLPDSEVFVSITTKTGFEMADKKLKSADGIFAFPFDIPFVQKSVFGKLDPDFVGVVEVEIWPRFLRTSKLNGSKLGLLNARMSDDDFKRYLKFKWFFGEVVKLYDFVAARSDEDRERFVKIGVPGDKIFVSGNVKFDLDVSMVPESAGKMVEEKGLKGLRNVVVFGSTHQGEEELICSALKSVKEKINIFPVLVPRHPNRADVVLKILKSAGFDPVFFSDLPSGSFDSIVVDTIGDLMNLYFISDVAVVCGSLVEGVGGHNIIEPASLGKPVVIGEHYENFRYEVGELLKFGGAVVVDGADSLAYEIIKILSDASFRKELSEGALKFFEFNRGASEKIVRAILRVINEES